MAFFTIDSSHLPANKAVLKVFPRFLFFAAMSAKIYNKGFSEISQLAVFLGMWGIGIITGSLASAAVWKMMTGQGLMNMAQDMLNPEYAGAIKVIQAISTLFIFFVPAVAYAFVCFKNGWLALGWYGKPLLRPALLSILILMACTPLIGALTDLNHAIPLPEKSRTFFDDIEKKYEEQVKVIGDVNSTKQYLLSLFMIALLPAVFEEVLFRGGIQNMLSRFRKSVIVYIVLVATLAIGIKTIWFPNAINNWLFYGLLFLAILGIYLSRPLIQSLNRITSHILFPVVCTAVLFSAIHGSWYGFLPRLALGIILGLVFYYTQNICYTIFMHFANNASVVTYMYLSARQQKTVEVNDDYHFPWWAALISLAVLYFLFTWLWKLYRKPAPVEWVYDRHNPFGHYTIGGQTASDEDPLHP